MEQLLVGLRVRGIALDGPEGVPLVVLEDRLRGRQVALPASPFEASAIIMELEGITPPRPLTHDLLAELFVEGGLVLDGVLLYGGSGGGSSVRARLDYRKGPRRLEREARPADAIALAIRLGATIAAEPGLLEPSPPSALAAGRAEAEREGRRRSRILLFDEWRERAVGA